MSKADNSGLSQQQVEKELEQALASVDPVRADSLTKLQRMRTVKTKSIEREQLRLTKKLGKDHPRVQKLTTRLEHNIALVHSLQLEAVRAQTEIPEVDENSWILHGRVLNSQLKPVAGLKTVLYDKSGCSMIEACGKEHTNKTGYFRLIIKEVAAYAKDEAGQDEPVDVFLHVLDKNDVTLHEDKRPLPILAGQVQYLEVVINDGDVTDKPWTDTGTGRLRTKTEKVPGVKRPSQTKTRYLGNSNSREFHDLNSQKPACQIDEIRPDHQISFKTQKEALALGYDYCAYCFGKDKSKR